MTVLYGVDRKGKGSSIYCELIRSIEAGKGQTFCLGIDGPGTSGKTSLAERLHGDLGGEVIHVDDYFLPFESRSSSRLSRPMGNIEWERLEQEILNNLGKKSVMSAPFDCASGVYAAHKEYDLSGLVILEGVSSLRREFRDYYNYKLFLSIPDAVRLERIFRRDPEWKQEKWLSQWIPWEDNYFNTHDPAGAADLILDGTKEI